MTEIPLPAKLSNPIEALQMLSSALASGNIKQAHQLQQRFLKLNQQRYAQEMVLTFHKLELQLKELEDWQHYATNTKRRELWLTRAIA